MPYVNRRLLEGDTENIDDNCILGPSLSQGCTPLHIFRDDIAFVFHWKT